jgi:hypothetical protein
MSRQLALSSTISAMVMALFVVTASVHAEAAPADPPRVVGSR